MFGRLSSSLSRIFHCRVRRGARANDGPASEQIARLSTLDPSPPQSQSQSLPRRLVPLQLGQIITSPTPPTTRSRPLFVRSLLSPIAQSPITPSPPSVTPITDALTPILIISRDPAESQSSLPPPTSTADVGPQTHADDVSPIEPPLVSSQPSTRRVSFQLPPSTRPEEAAIEEEMEEEERPESPLSMCSTLVPDEETQAEAEIRPQTPLEQGWLDPEAPDFGPATVPLASTELDAGMGGVVCSDSGRGLGWTSPGRFTSPATPVNTGSTNAKHVGIEGKRLSLMSVISGLGLSKKEKRTSGWETDKHQPRTREVLSVLSSH